MEKNVITKNVVNKTKKRYLVNVYHTYSTSVEVDADNAEDAVDIAKEQASKMPLSQMDYCDVSGSNVIPFDENGNLDYDQMEEF
jgi:hypothetical protein